MRSLVSNGFNVYLLLSNDPQFGPFRLNGFSLTVDYDGREIRDADYAVIRNKLNEIYDINPEESEVARQINLIATENPYNPLQDYLNGLVWDGTARLDDWLTKYLGTPESNFARAVGRKFLIAAVARALRPGCKADDLIILEGRQGIKKSSALSILASPDYFTDTPIDIGSRDSRLALQRAWIVELAELESLRKSESTRTKAFFSQSTDDYRPPYGRNLIRAPRHCVFAGTSNRDDYLQDETGNRRFWPVRCTNIDLGALSADRDQLWAEATAAYRAGEKWWLADEEEMSSASEATAQRVEADLWEDALSVWLEKTGLKCVSRQELLLIALNIEFKAWTGIHDRRVGRAMRALGYPPKQIKVDGRVRRFYVHDSAGPMVQHHARLAAIRQKRAVELATKGSMYVDETVRGGWGKGEVT